MNWELYHKQDCYGKAYMTGMELVSKGIAPTSQIEYMEFEMRTFPESKERLQEYIDSLKADDTTVINDENIVEGELETKIVERE